MKFNFGKNKVLVSGGITKDGLSISKVDPRGVCSLRVRPTHFGVQCGKWIHGRCVEVKMVSTKIFKKFCMQKA